MFVFLNDGDATFLYFFGVLFGDEINIIKFLIKNLKENDIFYDIGANYGFYTLLAQEFITTGEIHSFEPNPNIFKLLKENVKLDLFKNTFLNELALSDKKGESEFYNLDIKGHSGASSLIKYDRFKKIRNNKSKNYKIR
jgi:FkbM family methyltransferase